MTPHEHLTSLLETNLPGLKLRGARQSPRHL